MTQVQVPPMPAATPPAVAIGVRVGRIAPKGCRSAKLRGKGQLVFDAGGLRIEAKIIPNWTPGLCAIGATILTLVAVTLMQQMTGFGLGPGLIIWYLIFQYVLRQARTITPAGAGKAVYMPKRRIVSLELPDSTWVALRPHQRDVGRMMELLESHYGQRLVTAK